MSADDVNELLNLVADTPERELFKEVSDWLDSFYMRAWTDGYKEGLAQGRAYGYSEMP
jgi:hypothetical protein